MKIILDGKTIEVLVGETILEVARRTGIHIPTLCYHEALGGEGNCRMCTVEIKTANNAAQLVTSCSYPITSPIEVQTASPAVEKLRRNIIMLLYKRAPNSDFMKGLYQEYQCPENELLANPEERCILCRLCVRACAQIGASAISVLSRGTDKRVGTPYDQASTTCIGCAACAQICPTGAIQLSTTDEERTIWNKTFTLVNCEYCGQAFATREQLDYIASRTGLGGYEGKLCADCRRHNMVRWGATPSPPGQ